MAGRPTRSLVRYRLALHISRFARLHCTGHAAMPANWADALLARASEVVGLA